MKKHTLKRLISLMLAAVILLMPAALTSCADDGVTLKINGKKVFSTSGAVAMWQTAGDAGDVTLSLTNRTSSDVSLTVYTPASDTGIFTLTASSGKRATEKASLATASDALCGGVRLVTDDIDASYIITADGLSAAVGDGGSIFLLCGMAVSGDLNITAPLTLDTDGNTLSVEGGIFFSHPGEGTLSLGGNITADGFFASAPLCDIQIPASLIPDDIGYCVSAKTLNSTSYGTAKTVDSFEELLRLADNDCYPVVTPGDEIVLGAFTVTSPVTLDEPCSLSAEGTAFSYPVTVKTENDGNVTIGGGIDVTRDVIIDAPMCDVRADNLKISDAAQLFTAKSFFGYVLSDYRQLGLSPAPTLLMLSSENTCLSGDTTWQNTSAGVLSADISAACAPSTLRDANLVLTSPAGYTAEIDPVCKGTTDARANLLSPLGCYIRLTDDAGAKSIYEVVTNVDALLPCVVINTLSGEAIVSKDDYVEGTVSVQSDFSPEIAESLDTTSIEIAGRGNSTWRWSEKKPYKIKFAEKTSVLGLPKAKKWVLLANYADKSLMRNYVALETAKVLDNFDSYATEYPVDVFMNGLYAGVYTMGESVSEGENRVEIRQNATSTDCGFLLELNGDDDESCDFDMFATTLMSNMEIVYPDSSALTQKQAAYIENYMNIVESTVTADKGSYDDYLDTDSLIDWFIMIELSYNSDSCFRRSVFMKKDSMGKLEMAQVWDFDLAYGNNVNDTVYDCFACMSPSNYVGDNWMRYLMNDERFSARLKSRWLEVRDSVLAAELSAVDHAYALIAPSAANNFAKYDILAQQVGLEPPETLAYTTYEAQKNRLIAFITSRWSWLNTALSQ